METLSKIGTLFGDIVDLFGTVFDFLPSWVFLFMGSAVLFSVGIFIYKLIRG